MGGNDSQPDILLLDFPMHKYLNRGLTQKQVLQIKEAFDCYQPTNGVIMLDRYRERMGESSSKEVLSKYLAGKDSMNFDEFFSMEKEVLSSQLKSDPNLEFEIEQIQPVSFFCPYAQEVNKR